MGRGRENWYSTLRMYMHHRSNMCLALEWCRVKCALLLGLSTGAGEDGKQSRAENRDCWHLLICIAPKWEEWESRIRVRDILDLNPMLFAFARFYFVLGILNYSIRTTSSFSFLCYQSVLCVPSWNCFILLLSRSSCDYRTTYSTRVGWAHKMCANPHRVFKSQLSSECVREWEKTSNV